MAIAVCAAGGDGQSGRFSGGCRPCIGAERGLEITDFDVIESTRAFAAQPWRVNKGAGSGRARVNPQRAAPSRWATPVEGDRRDHHRQGAVRLEANRRLQGADHHVHRGGRASPLGHRTRSDSASLGQDCPPGGIIKPLVQPVPEALCPTRKGAGGSDRHEPSGVRRPVSAQERRRTAAGERLLAQRSGGSCMPPTRNWPSTPMPSRTGHRPARGKRRPIGRSSRAQAALEVATEKAVVCRAARFGMR